ncbi:MAG: hypothetical protein HQM16_02500 [Deltaproteobacteria bacterium]|nr:hypothetical protein [Deltaproteobacteria bacterium]
MKSCLQVTHLTLTRLNSFILRGVRPRSVDFKIPIHKHAAIVFLYFIVLFLPFLSLAKEKRDGPDCKGKCSVINKQCDAHCALSPNAGDCQKGCNASFKDAKGYCLSSCATQPTFLEPCPGSGDDPSVEKTEDDCLYSCEDHYSNCVLSCRGHFEGGSPGIKNCYNSCNDTFAEEEGFCKFQCRTDFDFMAVCAAEE